MTTTINQKVYRIMDDKGRETFETLSPQGYRGLRKSRRWKSILVAKPLISFSVKIKTI